MVDSLHKTRAASAFLLVLLILSVPQFAIASPGGVARDMGSFESGQAKRSSAKSASDQSENLKQIKKADKQRDEIDSRGSESGSSTSADDNHGLDDENVDSEIGGSSSNSKP